MGGAAVELALITPMFVLLALLAVLAFRVVSAGSTTDAVAHAAARAATLQRAPEQAERAARDAAANALRTHDLTCAAHSLELDTDGLQPGSIVTATVTCQVDLNDLSGLGVPGEYEAHSTATAVVDTYRGLP